MSSIVLPSEYGYVIIAASAIALQVVIHGAYVGMARRKAFNADYYRQEGVKSLLEVHKAATGESQLPKGGYPDMGNGRYSAELAYKDWYAFNNAQRVHGNYVEGVASALVVTLLSGLFFPSLAASMGIVYVIGREVYAQGYRHGPSYRTAGAVILDIALVILALASFYGGYQLSSA